MAPNTPRAVFVDKLIRHTYGHNLEYCVRLGRKLAALGYKPVVVANREFEGRPPEDVELRPEIRFDWLKHVLGRTRKAERKKRRRLETELRRAQRKARWRDTALGRAYIGIDDLRRGAIKPSQLGRLALPALAVAAVAELARVSSRLLALPFVALVRLLAALLRLLGAGRVKALFVRAWRAVAVRASVNPAGLEVLKSAWREHARRAERTDVDRSTGAALLRLGLSGDDMVLMTTMNEAELAGALDIVKRRPELARAHWHFVFREPLFLEEHSSYVVGQGQRALRVALTRARALLGDRAHFWTDTLELSEQYEALGVYPFGTLPIAMPDEIFDFAEDRVDETTPCVFGYLGDARPEKGFVELPAVVEALAVGDVRPDVRFLVQTNYNVPGGIRATRSARLRLEHMDNFGVRTIDKPQDGDEYLAAVRACDALLVAYTSPLYFAGSSGILAEALAAGRAAIAYDNTWSGRCLRTSAAYRAHLQQLADTYADKSFAISHDAPVAPSATQKPKPTDLRRVWTAAAARNTTLVRPSEPESPSYGRPWKLDAYTTHLLVRLECDLPGTADHLKLDVVFNDKAGREVGASVRYFSARDRTAWAAVKTPEGAETVTFGETRLHPLLDKHNHVVTVFKCALPEDVPVSAAGVLVHGPEDLAGAVAEVARFKGHYRRTAAAVSRGEWRAAHALSRMAGLLAESVGRLPEPEPSPVETPVAARDAA